MKIKIPKSFYDQVRGLRGFEEFIGPMGTGYTKLTCDGPYGQYEIVPVPDEEYTDAKEELVLVRRYKTDGETVGKTDGETV